MGKKDKEITEELPAEEVTEATPEVDPWEEKYNAEHDAYLRLYADYDNYRKRTAKEKDAAYGHGKADTVGKLLPVYDNLERALMQETADAAYKKGVEMTMTELQKIFTALGVEIFGEVGQTFDPEMHNAIMHTEDEALGENVIAAVFQKGARLGGQVIRFAMVQVAN